MGDFRKDILGEDLPESLRAGIRNHILVDAYTDKHHIINELKNLFSAERRRFAGIILDVSFDYFLSRHWSRYSEQDRREFIQDSYARLALHLHLMPLRMQYVVQTMMQQDWLSGYSELAGIDHTMNRISGRIRFRNCLHGAIEEVQQNYLALEAGFLAFYPQLQQHVLRHNASV